MERKYYLEQRPIYEERAKLLRNVPEFYRTAVRLSAFSCSCFVQLGFLFLFAEHVVAQSRRIL